MLCKKCKNTMVNAVDNGVECMGCICGYTTRIAQEQAGIKSMVVPQERSPAEELFLEEWNKRYPHILWEREYVFAPPRKFRLDFYDPKTMVAVEVDGVADHRSMKGWLRDIEKHNLITTSRIRLFRCTYLMLKKRPGEFIRIVRNTMKGWDKYEEREYDG